MKRHTNFRQECLGVLPAQPLPCRLPNRPQEFATSLTRLCIRPRKAKLIVLRPIIVLLLSGQERRKPCDDT